MSSGSNRHTGDASTAQLACLNIELTFDHRLLSILVTLRTVPKEGRRGGPAVPLTPSSDLGGGLALPRYRGHAGPGSGQLAVTVAGTRDAAAVDTGTRHWPRRALTAGWLLAARIRSRSASSVIGRSIRFCFSCSAISACLPRSRSRRPSAPPEFFAAKPGKFRKSEFPQLRAFVQPCRA